MIKLPPCPATIVLAVVMFFPVTSRSAALPDYKLGDIAREDIVTPVALLVVNPEATDALKQRVAQDVPTIIRFTAPSAAEAEAALRASIATAKVNFLSAFKRALEGRKPTVADMDSPVYIRTIRELPGDIPKNLLLVSLAPLWIRGVSDEAVVESLLQPVREVMLQPIVEDKMDNPIPPTQPVRLIQVQNAIDSPSLAELDLDGVGATITPGKVISLLRARRVVETYFPSGQDEMGFFAASFVKANAYPALGLTEILRARRMDGVTVNDTYEPAQVIIKKGQIIDRKALAALTAAREKSLIGTLQSKLEQEETVASQISRQTKWITMAFGGMGLVLVVILWRLRARPGNALVPVTATYQSLPGSGQYALPGEGGEKDWRDRALVAEVKAERAHEAIRTGALGWMREKIFQTLFQQRAELLSVQQKAEAEMRELEQRLEQLHTPLQERILAYEKRIEELEQDLAAKGEENRELIGARINVAKQQLNVERGRFGTN